MRVKITVLRDQQALGQVELAACGSLLIGRSAGASLVLDLDGVDGYHAIVEIMPFSVTLRDLSGGRTTLGGRPVPAAGQRLESGDRAQIAGVTLAIEIERESHATTQLDLALGATLAQEERTVAVRCSACGERSSFKESASEAPGVAYFCTDCQLELAQRAPSLPGYRVLRELGRGGMGVVYLAEHESGERRVLKQLLPEVAVRERNRQLFVREARKQAGLSHPNLVELYDFVEAEPGIFVAVLEFVDGESCDALAERRGGSLDVETATSVVEQALLGLSFMHQRGLVHRDLKESNLLVSRPAGGQPGRVKIADFGLAKSFQDAGASLMLTKTGQVGGTVPYMAPEQIRNFRDARPAADIYSMGATLYRLLSGSYPHDFPEGRHPYLVALTDARVPLARRRPDLPAGVVAVVERALSTDPDARFASADEMREALLAARGEACA